MRAAILIIGSLLWDHGARSRWRESRLHSREMIHVRVPIRYGRLSSTRGRTFTMTFDSEASLGQAVVVPYSKPIYEPEDLWAEADELWAAESRRDPSGAIADTWGSVGALFREHRQTANMRREWAVRYASAVPEPIPPIDRHGELHIPWPVQSSTQEPVDFDVVLATATKAEAVPPEAVAVADAWVNQNHGFEEYFFENIRHGIRTNQDFAIWRRIEESGPRWLGRPSYAQAVAILRSAEVPGIEVNPA